MAAARPGVRVRSNDAFDAGGVKFTVVEPFRRLDLDFDGRLCVLERPFEMANPGKAFRNNPMVEARLHIEYEGVSPMFGGEPVNEDGSRIEQKAEEAFARAHCEQHVAGRGYIEVGEPHRGGMVLRNNEYVMIRDARIGTAYDEHFSQTRMKGWARTDEREYNVEGKVMSLIPLRNRRQAPTGRC